MPWVMGVLPRLPCMVGIIPINGFQSKWFLFQGLLTPVARGHRAPGCAILNALLFPIIGAAFSGRRPVEVGAPSSALVHPRF